MSRPYSSVPAQSAAEVRAVLLEHAAKARVDAARNRLTVSSARCLDLARAYERMARELAQLALFKPGVT